MIIIASTIIVLFATFFTIYKLSDNNQPNTLKITTTASTSANKSKTKILLLNKEKKELIYNHQYIYNDKEVYDIYTDELKNEYDFYNKSGDLRAFILFNTSTSKSNNFKNKLTKDQIKNIAEDFVKNNANISNYKYVDTLFEKSEYRVTYSRFVQGYQTIEDILVILDPYGFITHYVARYQGMFDDFKTKINREKISSSFDAYIKKEYGNIKYTINYEILTLNNDANMSENRRHYIEFDVNFDRPVNEGGNRQKFGVDIETGKVVF